MAKMKACLPAIFLQNGHTVSSVIDALKEMLPGQYVDMITGAEDVDRVHVTRHTNGRYEARHIRSRAIRTNENTARLAQFIMNQVR